MQNETATGKGVRNFPFIIVLARQYYNIPSGLKYHGTAEKVAWALVK